LNGQNGLFSRVRFLSHERLCSFFSILDISFDKDAISVQY